MAEAAPQINPEDVQFVTLVDVEASLNLPPALGVEEVASQGEAVEGASAPTDGEDVEEPAPQATFGK